MSLAIKSSVSQTITDFNNYIRKNGGPYSVWYVGVASDPRGRLFNDHNVQEHGGAWIYDYCGSDTAARQVEQYFLRLGCQGGPGGGDFNTKYAYAYKMTFSTNP